MKLFDLAVKVKNWFGRVVGPGWQEPVHVGAAGGAPPTCAYLRAAAARPRGESPALRATEHEEGTGQVWNYGMGSPAAERLPAST